MPPSHEDEGQPLREFEWSDDIVGMGFFPSEVALPDDWARSHRSDPPRAPRRMP